MVVVLGVVDVGVHGGHQSASPRHWGVVSWLHDDPDGGQVEQPSIASHRCESVDVGSPPL